MADQKLTLTVQVNAQTGQLEVVGQKLAQTATKAKQVQSSFAGLGGEAKSLMGALLPFATAGGIAAFFTNAVKGAEQEAEAMRRLKFAVDSTTDSWQMSGKQVQAWLDTVDRSTRFSDGQAIPILERFVRVTGSTGQAMQASQIAMGLHIQTGKSLNFISNLLSDTINGEQGALMQLKREFGAIIPETENFQTILDSLNGRFSNLVFQEEGLTKSTASLSNAWGRFSDSVGDAVSKPLAGLLNFFTKALDGFDQFALIVAGEAAKIAVAFGKIGESVKAAFSLDFKGAVGSLKEIPAAMDVINQEVEAQFIESEQKKTAAAIQGAQQRIIVSETSKVDESLKLVALEQQLDAQLAALDQQTLSQKLAVIDAETKAKKTALTQQFKAGTDLSKAEAKLDEISFKRKLALSKAEIELKTATALQTMDVAVQTLAVLNEMTGHEHKSQVNRAKAILALEKAIAIARVWSSPQAALNPALAAAQTGLIIAQFAQQSQAISRASSAFQSGQSEFSISTRLPGGGNLFETNPAGGTSGIQFGGSSGGGGVSAGGGGTGSGSGGGNVINVGPIVLNIDKVDFSSPEAVRAEALRLVELVQQGSIEGVQLALALGSAASKNAGQAV